MEQSVADAYLSETAAALSPVIERERLLEHSASRERTLIASAERRLMRLGFDLHDGPIQDVLALAGDVQLLQKQVYPFILEDYREQAHGRFDDLSGRLVELDRQLREIAHSLETKSVISRPLGEILHREIDTFAERTGIQTELEIRGDPDSLSSAQRITVFRAIQEALANVREHAGATHVTVRVRARRSAIELQIVDDGMGFEVERALAKAAQRGRLGLVGIGERVHMVGRHVRAREPTRRPDDARSSRSPAGSPSRLASPQVGNPQKRIPDREIPEAAAFAAGHSSGW